MRDVETRMLALGDAWEPPVTPDLVTAVLAGRPSASPARTRPRRLLVGFAASAVALGALAAIAPARNAILDFFDIGGVRVETRTATDQTGTVPPFGTTPALTPGPVDPAPTPGPAQTVPLSPPEPAPAVIDLETARRDAPYLRAPSILPEPDDVLVASPFGAPVYEMLWDHVPAVAPGALRLTQLRGTLVLGKTIDPATTTVRDVQIGDRPGVWLSGGPHTIGYLDPSGELRLDTLRAAGDVLVWEDDGVTVRVEGASGLDAALRVAGSLR